jgi:hypothetical protein
MAIFIGIITPKPIAHDSEKGDFGMKFIFKLLLLDGPIIALLAYYYTDITIQTATLAALVFTVISYYLVDQLILRSTNNRIATLCDGVLSVVYLWILASMFHWTLGWDEILTTSATLAVAEWVFHRYILKPDSWVIAKS